MNVGTGGPDGGLGYDPESFTDSWDDGERRVVVVTVTFVAIGYLALAILAAITLPWRGLADAGSHLNYVQHVHEGRLLEPYGSGFEHFHRQSPPDDERRHYASAHPPGYYAAMAVIAGADLEDGHWKRAVAKIRAANVALGFVGLLALAAFGWVAGGRFRVRLAIALPMVGTANFAYLRWAGEVYNDMAVTTVALVVLTVGAHALVRGPTWVGTVALAVLCAIGMGMKATFVVTLGIVCLMVLVGAILHAPRQRRQHMRGIAAAAVIAITALASFAWFYERNRRLSGTWHRSTPKVPVGNRPERTLREVITDLHSYLLPVQRLVGSGAPHFTATARRISRTLAVPALVLSVIMLARVAPPRRWSRPTIALVVLLILHLAGHQVMQLSHAVGYGAFNSRYFLPATITLAAGLGFGLASTGRASALLLPGLAGSLWVANVISMATYGRTESEFESLGVLGALRDGALANDLPGWLPMGLLLVAFVSIAGVTAQIWTNSQHFGRPGARPQTDSADEPERPTKIPRHGARTAACTPATGWPPTAKK